MKPLRCLSAIVPGVCLGILISANLLNAQSAAQPAAAAQRPKYRTHIMVYEVRTGTTKTIFTGEGEFHAPNWTADGKYIYSDSGGAHYRIPVSGNKAGAPEKIELGVKMMGTNDHALSWDGKQLAITGITGPPPTGVRSAANIHNSLFIANIDGSNTHEVHLGWLHGWAPDNQHVVYTQYNKDNFDIYRINLDGSGELQLTTNKAADDGPEYSADGKWIYFCSFRSSKWDTWRMPADGAGPDDKLAERITHGDAQEWFPHISLDGKWLYVIAYPIDHPDHGYVGPGMKIKVLRLENGVAAKGAELQTVATFFGGQGSSNTSGWAPDSKKFVWSVYEALPAEAAK